MLDSKITLPLAMNVSTDVNPSAAKSFLSSSIFTVRPPTLIARRKAMYLGIAYAEGPLAEQHPHEEGASGV